MSAADRMVVRTPDGAYRSVPRRQGLGMISAGRAVAAREPEPVQELAGPPADVVVLDEDVDALLSEALAADTPPPTPKVSPLAAQVLAAYTPHPDELPEIKAERGPISYGGLEHVSDTPDPDVPTVDAVAFPPEPRGNASRKEWATYAISLGVEVSDNMTRNQIRDAAQDVAQTLDRLPQPARTGGRLETPEDEPAPERVADDEDPGTR